MSNSSVTTFEDIHCTFPATLQEALELLADESGRGTLLSGGTDLMVQWESGVLPMPKQAISIKQLSELLVIEEDGDEVIIGGCVTHMQLRRSPIVQQYLPSLASAAATVGGYQIQTMGTIAGNVANASPAADLTPSLMITDGVVVLASVRGEREVPLTSFWTGYRTIDRKPDELIVRFRLPKLPEGHHEYWRKLGPRRAQAISKVMGSCRIAMDSQTVRSFRVALGSVAPTCVRLNAVEKWIEGKTVTGELAAELEKQVSIAIEPIADIRSTAEYRKWVSGRIVRAFLDQALSGE